MTDREPSAEPAETAGPSALRAQPRGLRHWQLLGVFFCALATGLLSSYAFERVTGRGRVLRGVAVGDVMLAGHTPGQTTERLVSLRRRLVERSVHFEVAEVRFDATPQQLGFDLDVARLTEAALGAGRAGHVIEQFRWWFARLFSAHEVPLQAVLDSSRLEQRLLDWERHALADRATNGGITYDNGLRVEYPRPGRRIDRQTVTSLLLKRLVDVRATVLVLPVVREEPRLTVAQMEAAVSRAKELIAGPVELVSETGQHRILFSPDDLGRALRIRVMAGPKPAIRVELDPKAIEEKLAPLRASIDQPSQPARFSVDARHRIEIIPSSIGIEIDAAGVHAFLEAVSAESARIGVLPFHSAEPPELTTAEAQSLGIARLVASFVTYHPCCQARVKNIHHIAGLVDGVVLRPGESFSLNERVGPRGPANGFVLAPGIEEGDMVDTYGGGISQFTTTLFNAVLDGGYEILQRQPHSYYFPRYPVGLEATLSYPSPDLAFKNDTKNGLLLKTQYGARFIKVLLYGDNGGRKVIRKVGKHFDFTEPPNEYQANAELSPVSAVVKSRGTQGWSVIVGRVIEMPDGGTTEQSRKVTYNPRPRVVEVHPCNIPEGAKGFTGEPCPETVLPDAGVDSGVLDLSSL